MYFVVGACLFFAFLHQRIDAICLWTSGKCDQCDWRIPKRSSECSWCREGRTKGWIPPWKCERPAQGSSITVEHHDSSWLINWKPTVNDGEWGLKMVKPSYLKEVWKSNVRNMESCRPEEQGRHHAPCSSMVLCFFQWFKGRLRRVAGRSLVKVLRNARCSGATFGSLTKSWRSQDGFWFLFQ